MIDKIRAERIKQGITQKQLAKMVNMHQISINRIENLHYSPTLDAVLAICKALNLKIKL